MTADVIPFEQYEDLGWEPTDEFSPDNCDDAPAIGATWIPVDLRARMADGYVKPVPTMGLVEGAEFPLFYPGAVNAVFGDSGGGKTWLAAMVMAEALNTGRDALFLDYEDQPETAVSRLEALGVPLETIFDHLIYIRPVEPLNLFAKENLKGAVIDRDIAVAVLDSTGEAMATDGCDGSDDAVARWFRGTCRALASVGTAVVILDHVVKGQAGMGRNTSFAIGSQRKRAAITGAAYYLEVISAPSKDSDGRFRLVTKKDRHGWRKHEVVACVVDMKNRPDGSIEWTIALPIVPKNADGTFRPTVLMERLSRHLEGVTDPAGLSKKKVEDEVSGKKEALAAALNVLVTDGYVSEAAGPRNARLFTSVRPYRQDEDAAASPEAKAAPTNEPW